MRQVSRQPTLYLLCGLPGAGKTTLAQEIEAKHGALRLTPDEWIAELLSSPGDVAERDRLREPIESLQWRVAKQALALGSDVILDWGLWSKDERDRLRSEATELGAQVEIAFLNPPREELVRRLRERQRVFGAFEVSEDELDRWSNWLEVPSEEELSK